MISNHCDDTIYQYISRNMLFFQELHKGDYLWYNNKEYKAMFQDDGNFMIYSWKPVWNSDTAGQDENVVGHTNTHRLDGGQMCRLSLRNDGTVVIERVRYTGNKTRHDGRKQVRGNKGEN
uniref:Uncharacterized protein n=1 Tax=Denticeps clupeoides TaxID=299321 RepID=A0AAY4DUU4_9TELE